MTTPLVLKNTPEFDFRIPRAKRDIPDVDWKPLIFATGVDGVFEGGAALGAAYVGSLRLMQENGLWFRRVAGNSAGAITAALIAVGYNAQEIEWLTSNFSNRPPRPSSLPSGLQPIDFLDFLDWPSSSDIRDDSMRRTTLWKGLKGEALDQVLRTKVPGIPLQKKVVAEILKGLRSLPGVGLAMGGPGVEQTVKDTLDLALGFLPDRTPRLSDFSLFDETSGMRKDFADAVWKAIAAINPLLVISTQLLHEGSLFEGKEFYRQFSRLLGAKKHQNENATVLFQDLPIPLVVIGCNYATGKMEVYSSKTHPTMIVADAVRRSMSLPLVFEPVGPQRTIIDGGLISNFPVWLYTTAGDKYWPATAIDPARPIIGLSLNEHRPAKAAWQAAPGKFPPRVNPMDVWVPILIAKLKDVGLYVPTLKYSEAQLKSDLQGYKLLEVVAGWTSIDKEHASREPIIRGLMNGKRYFDVVVPLEGFHGLDFCVNSNREDMRAMAERGYFAARDALAAAPIAGAPLLSNPNSIQNPYA